MIEIPLEVFVENAKLPEGYKFYDFSNGQHFCPVPNGEYLSTVQLAVERVIPPTGYVATLQFSYLTTFEKSPPMVDVCDFAQEIEKLIAHLEERVKKDGYWVG